MSMGMITVIIGAVTTTIMAIGAIRGIVVIAAIAGTLIIPAIRDITTRMNTERISTSDSVLLPSVSFFPFFFVALGFRPYAMELSHVLYFARDLLSV